MSVNKKSVSAKRIWILAISSIFLLVLLSKCTDGFKLKDITAHDQEDGNKSPRKIQPLYSTGGKATQFRKIVKVVKIEDDDEAEDEENEEESDEGPDPDYKFEKVRKADKVEVDKAEPIFKTIEKEEEKEQDLVVEEAKEALSFSVLSLLRIFGIGDGDEGLFSSFR